MSVSSDATLNLSQLLHHDATDYEVSGEGLLLPEEALLESGGLRLAGPLEWQLTVRSTGGDDDFILDGRVAGTALMECRRCLEDVPVSVESDLIYPMVYRPGSGELTLVENGEDEEELLSFGRPDVDFAPLLTQVFAIDLPLTALCREDCRGLAADGVNLNEHPEHGGAPATPDAASPFAALKKLEL
jgi:uncharacterized protein